MILFLNDFGTGELFFIMAAVLMLFGAKSMPSIARTLGKGMKEIKHASDEIKRDIAKSASDMRRELNVDKHIQEFKKPFDQIEKSITEEPKKTNKQKNIDTDA